MTFSKSVSALSTWRCTWSDSPNNNRDVDGDSEGGYSFLGLIQCSTLCKVLCPHYSTDHSQQEWEGGKNTPSSCTGFGGLVPPVQSELRSGRTRILTLVCPSSRSIPDHRVKGLRLKVTVACVRLRVYFPSPHPPQKAPRPQGSPNVHGMNGWMTGWITAVSLALPRSLLFLLCVFSQSQRILVKGKVSLSLLFSFLIQIILAFEIVTNIKGPRKKYSVSWY